MWGIDRERDMEREGERERAREAETLMRLLCILADKGRGQRPASEVVYLPAAHRMDLQAQSASSGPGADGGDGRNIYGHGIG